MSQVQLVDHLGYTVGEPVIPEPLPMVIVWGEDFFVANTSDAESGAKNPRYHITTGLVITDTRELPGPY